jgi:hypothetical protein
VALVVTREGFPLAHFTWAGNTRDLDTVKRLVEAIEARFGKSQRIWVMDRGMISDESLTFLEAEGRRYLLATKRSALNAFAAELRSPGWHRLPDNPDVEVKQLTRAEVHYLLARSRPRRQKERAIRRRQRRGLAKDLKKLQTRVNRGRLKQRDKILEAVGRLKERYPKARVFVTITVSWRKDQGTGRLILFSTALSSRKLTAGRRCSDGGHYAIPMLLVPDGVRGCRRRVCVAESGEHHPAILRLAYHGHACRGRWSSLRVGDAQRLERYRDPATDMAPRRDADRLSLHDLVVGEPA